MVSASQSAAYAVMVRQRQLLDENVRLIEANKPGAHPLLQALVCEAVGAYNVFASTEGWPVFPAPAFCSNPPAK